MADVKVLVVEDGEQYVGYFAEELAGQYGHEVAVATSPASAEELLATSEFEVAVVDILFDEEIERFDQMAATRRVPLTADRLIVSGLTVLRNALAANVSTAVWTSGEPNRHLHLIFAFETLGVRSFCSKRARGGSRTLHQAIVSAAEGRRSIDPLLQSYMLPDGAPSLARTIFSEPVSKRMIWRALAVGAHSRDEVEDLTGIAARYVGKLTQAMFDDLALLDPGTQHPGRWRGRSKLNELVRYASTNRAFFLDDAVRTVYP
jgi:DNA-binding NarL/FixJ family response regulator